MVPDNFRVAVAICPVCHEPVIADMPLFTNNPNPGALIRHHIERRVDKRLRHVYCQGSKREVFARNFIELDSAELARKQ